METTEKHFKIFEKAVISYLEKFNLSGWDITIVHMDNKSNFEWQAWKHSNYRSRRGTIALSKEWGDEEITDEKLNYFAYHEVMHFVLEPLLQVVYKARDTVFGNVITEMLDGKSHEIIWKLKNLLK